MFRRLAVLALAVAVAACGSDDGPGVATIDQMRVIKVRGDQATQVPPAGGPSPSVILAAVVGADGYTDEPLVARVIAEGEAGIMGIDAAKVPPGTLVHWNLPPEAGRLYGSTTATDDSAYVVNRYAPGTKAGTYTATAGRLVGGQIVTDATWTLEVLPGPAVVFEFADTLRLLQGKRWEWNTTDMRDTYGNPVPYTLAADSVATVEGARTLVGAEWGAGEYQAVVDDTVAWSGRVHVFPDLAARSERWIAVLSCATPDTLYFDRIAVDSVHPGLVLHTGGSRSYAYPWRMHFGERVVMAGADTVRQWDRIDSGGITREFAPTVIDRALTTDRWFVTAYQIDPHATVSQVFFPDTIPLASADSLIWRLDDAVDLCHDDGFWSATAGTFTVRPLD